MTHSFINILFNGIPVYIQALPLSRVLHALKQPTFHL